jgi:hypothetical protein
VARVIVNLALGVPSPWACTLICCDSRRVISPSWRSKGLLAMPCATSQVSTTLIGHSSSSGASIQSRISPKRERCSRGKAMA